MKFSDAEIEKAKELKKLNLVKKSNHSPQVGSFIWSRSDLEGCVLLGDQVYLIVSLNDRGSDLIWLPTFDELLEVSRSLQISFSMITDYLHRRRFADGREREGLYQILIERLR